jgi:KRAB domain-containing zinc finger protein
MSIKVCLHIGKGEPRAKQVKLAQKARKPQAAKNGPKKPFPCDQCESSFDRANALKIHIDSVHLGLKPHKCTQCDRSFGYKHDLTSHIKSAHENAFVCPQCNKTCLNYHKLNSHIETAHEGIRYKCDFCDKTFPHKGNIPRHVRSHHPNE